MAVETLTNITQDEIEYARMSTLLKSELDWQSGMVNAKREGLAKGLRKGLAKGRSEAKLEDARKMKADNMSASQISKYTGLSVETIAQL